ncbi:hypothetical protein C8R44DRAFT_878795 [Mycena epipterygia]|nr:hypothetical protein C8R44DRAFT_878795 [Mycena epipterygia]
MSLSNHHLAALLYFLINTRRQADIYYQLALLSHRHFEDALNEFALGVYQLESAIPQAAFAARWESPDTPDILRQIFERLQLTCESTVRHHADTHPPPMVQRNPPSDPEMSRRDPVYSYYTIQPPWDDGYPTISFDNHPNRLPSAKQVSTRTRAEAEASQPQPFNFLEAAPPRDGLSLSQIDRASQGDEALIFDDNSESASVVHGPSANASIRPPTPQVGPNSASQPAGSWREPAMPHSAAPSSDPRQGHHEYAPPPHPPPQYMAQVFVPQQHSGEYQGPPRSMFAGPLYVPPDAPAYYGTPAAGGHPGPRSAAPVVTAPVAPPTFTPVQLTAMASASQCTALLTSRRGADSTPSGQTSEGGAPSSSMAPPPSPALQLRAPSHSLSAAGDAGSDEMQVEGVGALQGDSGAAFLLYKEALIPENEVKEALHTIRSEAAEFVRATPTFKLPLQAMHDITTAIDYHSAVRTKKRKADKKARAAAKEKASAKRAKKIVKSIIDVPDTDIEEVSDDEKSVSEIVRPSTPNADQMDVDMEPTAPSTSSALPGGLKFNKKKPDADCLSCGKAPHSDKPCTVPSSKFTFEKPKGDDKTAKADKAAAKADAKADKAEQSRISKKLEAKRPESATKYLAKAKTVDNFPHKRTRASSHYSYDVDKDYQVPNNMSSDSGDILFDVSKTIIDHGQTVVDSGEFLTDDSNIHARRVKELKNEIFTCGYCIQHFLSLREYFLVEGKKLQEEYRAMLASNEGDEPPPLELASSFTDLFGDSHSDGLEYI